MGGAGEGMRWREADYVAANNSKASQEAVGRTEPDLRLLKQLE
jgi:hypothetical protein